MPGYGGQERVITSLQPSYFKPLLSREEGPRLRRCYMPIVHRITRTGFIRTLPVPVSSGVALMHRRVEGLLECMDG